MKKCCMSCKHCYWRMENNEYKSNCFKTKRKDMPLSSFSCPKYLNKYKKQKRKGVITYYGLNTIKY